MSFRPGTPAAVPTTPQETAPSGRMSRLVRALEGASNPPLPESPVVPAAAVAASVATTPTSPPPAPVAAAPESVPAPSTTAPPQIPSPQAQAYEQRQARKLLREALTTIRLDLVLEALQADPNQDGDRGKWKVHGFGNILVKGQAWKNANTEQPGYGGVFLVSKVLELTDSDAIDWMVERFGDQIPDHMKAAATGYEKKEFNPPEPDPLALGEVRRYLTMDRSLPVSLVDAEIAAGRLYASHPVDRERGRPIQSITHAVFISPVAAEVRGTTEDGFKGCCEGSDPDLSGYRVPHAKGASERILALTEAAVDALSYRVLFPGRFVVSTNGAGRFMLQFRMALEAVAQGFGVRSAFDADGAGDLAAQRLFNAFFVRAALAHQLKVDPEVIEDWILSEDRHLEILPNGSPHELFLRDGWKPECPVYEEHKEFNAEGKLHLVWKPSVTGAVAPPTVRIKVARDLHPQLRQGTVSLTVSQKAFDYVQNTVNIRRDRPERAKDWNEILKAQGPSFLLEYERCARVQFTHVPPLPDFMAHLRPGGPEKAPEPAPAPEPPPVQPVGRTGRFGMQALR